MKTRMLLILSFLLLIVGCQTPKTIFNPHFAPEDSIARWEQGKAKVTQEEDGIKVIATFLEGGTESLHFDVEVHNQSENPILVRPENIECELIHKPHLKLGPVLKRASNPEMEIRYLSQKAHWAEVARVRSENTNTIFSILELAGAVTAVVKDEPEIAHDILDCSNVRQQYHDINQIQKSDQIHALNDSRRPWEESCLRSNTLDPDQGTHGIVVFNPIDATQTERIELKVPVGEKIFTFKFKPTF